MPKYKVESCLVFVYNVCIEQQNTMMNSTFNKDEAYLFPAYGRKYDNFALAVEDWQDGKDFSINGFQGPYCSIRDFQALQARYAKIYLVNSSFDIKRIS